MEEILASIRQIISEEGAPDAYDAAGGRNEAPASGSSRGSASAGNERPGDTVAHGGSMKSNGAGPARGNGSHGGPEIVMARQAMPPGPDQESEEARLLSDGADRAVSTSFSALAHTILAQNARTLEDLVSEMLQPMLREWLDDNLPTLVERIVQEEIQRVSRGRR